MDEEIDIVHTERNPNPAWRLDTHTGPWEVSRTWNGYASREDGDQPRYCWTPEAVWETLRELDTGDPAEEIIVSPIELEPLGHGLDTAD